jgi:hypothetical protein
MNGQLAEMRSGGHDTTRIANATADFAKAMKDQAASTHKLVSATEDSANAAKSASDATAKGAAAAIKTAAAEIASADSARKSADTVAASATPHATFTGADIGSWDTPPDSKGLVEVPFTFHFTNTGGSAFHHGDGIIILLATKKLPEKPDYQGKNPGRIPFGGNEITIPPGGVLSTDKATYLFSPSDAKDIKSGKLPIFVYGYIDFSDSMNNTHHSCYATQIFRDATGRDLYFPIVNKEYIC